MTEITAQENPTTTEIAVQENPALVEMPTSLKEVINWAQVQATALMEVVDQQNLYQLIRGKKFLQAPAWQLIGSFLHIHAIPVEIEQIPEDGRIRYKCTVELRNDEGMVVGGGFGEAHNKEEGKGKLIENQIGSTAQTRAISKAYRNKYAFIAKLAGFESSTAEEVDSNGFRETAPETVSPQTAAPPKPNHAPSKVGKPIPKPEPTNGISVADFQAYRDTCLGIVEPEVLAKLASNLQLDGKKIGDMVRKDLDGLLAACQQFAEMEKKLEKAGIETKADDSPSTENGSEEQDADKEKMESFPVDEKEAPDALEDAWLHTNHAGAVRQEMAKDVEQKDVDDIPF